MLNLNDITFNKRSGSLIGRSFEIPYDSYCRPLGNIENRNIKNIMTYLNPFYRIILVIICFLASCQPKEKKEQNTTNELSTEFISTLAQKIDSVLLAKMKEEHLPGVSAVIVQNGRILYKKGFGITNIETRQKVDVDSTIFRIGSVSKALTMFALTKLIDQGKLSYETPVSKYFRDIENPFELQDTLKIKHILTHTGGLDQIGVGRQIQEFDLSLEERKKKRSVLSEFLENGNLRRIRPAGQHFTYDTYGSTLAGAIIENVTGLSYPEAMDVLIFKPLGMNLSSVEVRNINRHLLASGHGYKEGNYFTTPYELYLTLPASSIDASVADMGKLLEALTSNGSNSYGQLFSEKMMQKVISPQFRPHPEFVGMTHGLWEGTAFGTRPDAFNVRTLGHGGSMIGTTCNFNLTPELNLGIFVITNRNPESGGGDVSVWKIFNTVFEHYQIGKAPLFEIPNTNVTKDLNEYSGNYYHGIFCHTCNEEEFAKGAWRQGNAIEIKAKDNLLVIGDENYYMREKDIFVSEDGKEMLYFGRDKKGNIKFLVSSEDSTSYERI